VTNVSNFTLIASHEDSIVLSFDSVKGALSVSRHTLIKTGERMNIHVNLETH